MRVLEYQQPNTVLTGQIYTDYHYGRPNYGETPETDELEHAIFLALDEPFSIPASTPCGEGDYDAIGVDNVTRVQLAGHIDIPRLRNIRGHGVEVRGELFHAHTGHHHAEVLLSLGNEQPKVIDNRHTYPQARLKSSGTGFLLGHEGFIATAAHVVAGVLGVTVTRGLLKLKATVERVEPDTEVALLRVAPAGLLSEVVAKRQSRARPLRTWMSPQLGESMYAFGFPLRPVLPHTLNMTAGIVSAEAAPKDIYFQISAPIQKGNSGGPVCDQCGNVVGLVSSKLGEENKVVSENISFATRACYVEYLTQDLIERGTLKPESRDPIAPSELGKVMQELCVEVECWVDKSEVNDSRLSNT
jgi:S1-C subfamily serine protease